MFMCVYIFVASNIEMLVDEWNYEMIFFLYFLLFVEKIVFGNISFFLNNVSFLLRYYSVIRAFWNVFSSFCLWFVSKSSKRKKSFLKKILIIVKRYRWKIFFETKILWKCALILPCSTLSLSIFMILRMSRSYLSDFV